MIHVCDYEQSLLANSYMLIMLHAVQTTDNRLLHFINKYVY